MLALFRGSHPVVIHDHSLATAFRQGLSSCKCAFVSQCLLHRAECSELLRRTAHSRTEALAASTGTLRIQHSPAADAIMPTLYVDLISQPARACAIFCKAHQLPVDLQLVHIGKSEHQKAPYLAINPLGKIPFLVDGDLALPESAAILSYLAAKYHTPAHWCPPSSQLKQRALFDAAMAWWHGTIRAGSMALVFHRVIGPLRGLPTNPALADHGEALLHSSLSAMDTYWLQGGRRAFMTGDTICLADLLVAVHLDQLRLLVADPSAPQLEELLREVPAVAAWRPRVVEAAGAAAYAECNKHLDTLVGRLQQQAAQKQKQPQQRSAL